ncbi:MAG: hypothetical protein ACE363_07040 [Alphaproteobacteria bacterium]
MVRATAKRVWANVLENVTESGAACLITMVQGNLFAITLSHWIIASQTGLIAGTAASAILFLWRASKPWMVALILGAATALVDYFMHPGQFGPFFMEALVTGAGAAALSYLAALAFRQVRLRRERDA